MRLPVNSSVRTGNSPLNTAICHPNSSSFTGCIITAQKRKGLLKRDGFTSLERNTVVVLATMCVCGKAVLSSGKIVSRVSLFSSFRFAGSPSGEGKGGLIKLFAQPASLLRKMSHKILPEKRTTQLLQNSLSLSLSLSLSSSSNRCWKYLLAEDTQRVCLLLTIGTI